MHERKEKNAQAGDAAYGRPLLSNRGGWTLREMLGCGYEKFSAINAQKDFQESLERVSGRVGFTPFSSTSEKEIIPSKFGYMYSERKLKQLSRVPALFA